MIPKFDIFISYKHKSLSIANNLYYRLTTRNYVTFYDVDEMRSDNYDEQIFNYISGATDVFVILEDGSLDACKSPDWTKDWFLVEIAHAIKEKKNIIPLFLNGFKMPSEDFFPTELKELSYKHGPEFYICFFDAYLDKLVQKDIIKSKPSIHNNDYSIFKFYSNKDCKIFKEGKLVCDLKGSSESPFYLPVNKSGEFQFECVNIDGKIKKIILSINAHEEKIFNIIWRNSKRIFLLSWLCSTIILLFLAIIVVYNGYLRFDTCSKIEDLESYKPNNIIEKFFWNDKKYLILGRAYDIINAIESSYKCSISRSISLAKLEVLQDMLNNMSFIPDYCNNFDSIYVSKFEVSVKEWNCFMDLDVGNNDSIPVSNVSKKEICKFLDSLNFYSGLKFMIPNKHDWDFFARSNSEHMYAGSNNLEDIAWYHKNSNGKKHARGKKCQNNFDIFDISGNVAEILSQDTLINSKQYSFVKGGHYESFENELKIKEYDLLEDGKSSIYIGFRIIIKK